MKLILSFFFLCAIITTLNAKDISIVANELGLYAGTKATIQWERIFSSQRRMKKYRLDILDQGLQDKLKKYLIKHAADSQMPIVPGL